MGSGVETRIERSSLVSVGSVRFPSDACHEKRGSERNQATDASHPRVESSMRTSEGPS